MRVIAFVTAISLGEKSHQRTSIQAGVSTCTLGDGARKSGLRARPAGDGPLICPSWAEGCPASTSAALRPGVSYPPAPAAQ